MLKIPTGRRQTSWLFTSVAEAGLEPGASYRIILVYGANKSYRAVPSATRNVFSSTTLDFIADFKD